MDRQKTRERSELCMLLGACRQGTHTFKQMTKKKDREPPTHTQDIKKTQLTQQHGRNERRVTRKRATPLTRPTTTGEQHKQKQTEGDRKRNEDQKEKNKESSYQTPGPLQTTQGQDHQWILTPESECKGPGGLNQLQSEQETLPTNPWPVRLQKTNLIRKKTKKNK